jgi:hypothetical protein
MADPKYEVEGLSLPRGGLIRNQTFADDTAYTLEGSPQYGQGSKRPQAILPNLRSQNQLA